MNERWQTLSRHSPRLAGVLAWALSLAAGLLVAVVMHYVLYRMGLPSKPFIYVAF